MPGGGKGHEKKSIYSNRIHVKLVRNPIIHKPMYTELNVLENIIISATNMNIKGRHPNQSHTVKT